MGEPTWGEINYRAFEVCSNDFHNELYGHVQRYIEAQKTDGSLAKEKEIDDFLVSEGIEQTKTWVRNERSKYPRTLPVYVRNSIHHPENTANVAVTATELAESTKNLVTVVERINGLINDSNARSE